MVLKIQALQRRLIAKTEEVVEKDLLIQVGGWHCRRSADGTADGTACDTADVLQLRRGLRQQ
jgi:hypothetical protein